MRILLITFGFCALPIAAGLIAYGNPNLDSLICWAPFGLVIAILADKGMRQIGQ